MMYRVLLVLPLYGGSLPIGRYCASALQAMGCHVETFEAPDFFGAFNALKTLRVTSEKQTYLENSFLQLVSQAVLAKAERLEPDLVLCLAQAPMSRQVLSQLRKKGIPLVMWFVEDYSLFTYWRAYASYYDVFAVIQKEPFMGLLQEMGVANALYLPLAADPAIHRPLALSPVEKSRFGAELSFMGAGYPNRRIAFRYLRSKGLKIWGTEWDDAELRSLVQMEGKRIETEDSVRIFNASSINLNLHSSVRTDNPVPEGDFVNPRTFEIASCRAFQLVDKRLLMPELFSEDELATFGSLDELQEKIAFFQARPEERAAYAERGHSRVLHEHTYTARMRTLLDFVQERGLVAEKKRPAWPNDIPEDLRSELEAFFSSMNLPAGAGFDDAVVAVREKSGELLPLEVSLLFLDEWKKQYAGKR